MSSQHPLWDISYKMFHFQASATNPSSCLPLNLFFVLTQLLSGLLLCHIRFYVQRSISRKCRRYLYYDMGSSTLRRLFDLQRMEDSRETITLPVEVGNDCQGSSMEPKVEPAAAEVQEPDTLRTHVTETQFPLSQMSIQKEPWQEQQARLEPTRVQPGNKIQRPVIDDAPLGQGFEFGSVKGMSNL